MFSKKRKTENITINVPVFLLIYIFILQFTRNESEDPRGTGGGENTEQDRAMQALLRKLKVPRQLSPLRLWNPWRHLERSNLHSTNRKGWHLSIWVNTLQVLNTFLTSARIGGQRKWHGIYVPWASNFCSFSTTGALICAVTLVAILYTSFLNFFSVQGWFRNSRGIGLSRWQCCVHTLAPHLVSP